MKKSAKTQTAEGTVLSAKKIWFVHINRHPFRPTDRGGALFSYRVTFRFEAAGKEYTCKKRSAFLPRCPLAGVRVIVIYEADRPEKCRIRFCDGRTE